MSGGFTPGPWFTDGRLPGSGDYAVFAKDGVACIAFVKPGCLPAKGRDDAAEANAHLIAAAPDLYEALAGLAAATKTSSGQPCNGDWQKAFAALAKARGEQV